MLVILAATDKRNSPSPGLLPLALFLTLFGLGVCFGMQTGEDLALTSLLRY